MTDRSTSSTTSAEPDASTAALPRTDQAPQADVAAYYDQTHDVSGFDGGEVVHLDPVPVGTRNVTLSIRLSPEELRTLASRAEAAGMKVTTYIRSVALQSGAPLADDDLIDAAAEVVDLITVLRSSLETARARRDRVTDGSRPVADAS